MRALFIALTMMASVVSKADTPNTDRISPVVLQSFENTFAKAQEVSWTTTSDFYKAAFTFNGQYITAFYSEAGSLIAVTRNILTTQLPVKLQASLKCDYEHSWISDLFEVSNDEGTTYYITVENADKKVVLKSFGNDRWTVYSKIEKI